MRETSIVASWLCVACVCAGCPSTASPDASSAGDISLGLPDGGQAEDASTSMEEVWWRAHAESVASNLCAIDARCGSAWSQPRGGTLTSCAESVEAALAAPPSFAGARFDEERSAACFAALETLTGLDLAVAFTRDLLPLECLGVVHGDVPGGAACTRDECGEGRGVCGLDGTCPAVCTLLGGDGAPCSVSLQCADGLYCIQSGVEGACRALRSEGEPCGSSRECERGAHCHRTSDDWTVPGTCDRGDLAEGDLCEPELGCGSASLACVASRQGPLVMGTRDAVYTCETPRTDGSCRAGQGDCGLAQCGASVLEPPYEGSCEAQPGLGGDCSSAVDPPRCGIGLRCVGGTCAPVARLGAACTSDEACTTGRCVASVCVAIEPTPLCP
jgi:hypothetical protein